ncbi:hypothetical protein [Luteibacter sp.]|uniref:hypothetical protein n=1 Tax=Luteibacter sp. TaxID=1886636 RepID=UPI003F7FDE29
MIAACSSGSAHPDVKLNPSPVRFFELSAVVKNPPGDFDRVEAKAFYEVENTKCAPLRKVSGVRDTPHYTIDLPVTPAGIAYRARFAADALMDGDYFGQGVCHWRLTSVAVSFIRKRRGFHASIVPPQAHEVSSTAPYFSIESYEDSADRLIDTGLRDKSKITHPDKAFQIELTAKEATRESTYR